MTLLKKSLYVSFLLYVGLIPGCSFIVQKKYREAFCFLLICFLTFSLPAWLRLWEQPIGFLASLAGISILWMQYLHTAFYKVSPFKLKLTALDIFKSLLYPLVLFLLLTISLVLSRSLWGYQLFHIPSESMEPSLLVGDYVLVDSWKYQSQMPQKYDLIVFKKPFATTLIYNIKRVTHVQGEVFHQRVLQKNELAVMGDNRNDSEDSRVFGAITTGSVIGKAIWVVFSIDNTRHWRTTRVGLLLDNTFDLTGKIIKNDMQIDAPI